jgi:hypothetical protein
MNWALSAETAGRKRRNAQLSLNRPISLSRCNLIRFRSSRQVGAYYELTPSRYQSGETDISGRIAEIGDYGVRQMLYEAANVMLMWPLKGSALRDWALAVANPDFSRVRGASGS